MVLSAQELSPIEKMATAGMGNKKIATTLGLPQSTTKRSQRIDPKCMLFKACVLKNLLLAQGKDHITKMQFVFQNDPLSFLDCVFFHLRTLTKNNSEPRAPLKDFGEGPFENQG